MVEPDGEAAGHGELTSGAPGGEFPRIALYSAEFPFWKAECVRRVGDRSGVPLQMTGMQSAEIR